MVNHDDIFQRRRTANFQTNQTCVTEMESILRFVLEPVLGGFEPPRSPAKLIPFPTEPLDWSEHFASNRAARRDHGAVIYLKIEGVPVLLNQIYLLSHLTLSGAHSCGKALGVLCSCCRVFCFPSLDAVYWDNPSGVQNAVISLVEG